MDDSEIERRPLLSFFNFDSDEVYIRMLYCSLWILLGIFIAFVLGIYHKVLF